MNMKFAKMKTEDFVKMLGLNASMEIMTKINGLKESKAWKTSQKEEKDAPNVLI